MIDKFTKQLKVHDRPACASLNKKRLIISKQNSQGNLPVVLKMVWVPKMEEIFDIKVENSTYFKYYFLLATTKQ